MRLETIIVTGDYDPEYDETPAFNIVCEVKSEKFDLAYAIRDALEDYMKTEEGQHIYETLGYEFKWEDCETYLPEEICRQHGFKIIEIQDTYLEKDAFFCLPIITREKRRAKRIKEAPHGYGIFASEALGGAEYIGAVAETGLCETDEDAVEIAKDDLIEIIPPESLPDDLKESESDRFYIDTPNNRKIIRDYLKSRYDIDWKEPENVIPDVTFETNGWCPHCNGAIYIDMNGLFKCGDCDFRPDYDEDLIYPDNRFTIYVPIPNNEIGRCLADAIVQIIKGLRIEELGFDDNFYGWHEYEMRQNCWPFTIEFHKTHSLAEIPPRAILLSLVTAIAEVTTNTY